MTSMGHPENEPVNEEGQGSSRSMGRGCPRIPGGGEVPPTLALTPPGYGWRALFQGG